MLSQQRRQYLLQQLQIQGQIIAKQVAQDLQVSEDTIRRDLRELAKEGVLQRVHGGALPASPALGSLQQRQTISVDEKTALAKTAIQLIQAKQIIFLDGGTTTQQMAKQLPTNLEITVITHSPALAVDLNEYPLVEVILLGGKVFKHSLVTLGALALETLQRMHIDLYFMGVTGVHPNFGLTTGDAEEACMKRQISQQAAETYVLVSPEKLGKVSAYQVLPLSEVSGLITAPTIDEELLKPYSALNLSLLRATT
jgi:DeoR/GlpR family transcriptional regulator of sugar metabolism